MPAAPRVMSVSVFAAAPHGSSDVLREINQMRLAMEYVTLVHRTPPHYLLGPSRGGKHLSSSRQTLQYICHVAFGMNYTRIGELTNRDRTSVSYACRQIEALRDFNEIDKSLFFAEMALQAMMHHLSEPQS